LVSRALEACDGCGVDIRGNSLVGVTRHLSLDRRLVHKVTIAQVGWLESGEIGKECLDGWAETFLVFISECSHYISSRNESAHGSQFERTVGVLGRIDNSKDDNGELTTQGSSGSGVNNLGCSGNIVLECVQSSRYFCRIVNFG